MSLSKAIVDSLDGNFQTLEETVSNRKDCLKILKKASQNRVLYAFCDYMVKEQNHCLPLKLKEDIHKIVAWGESWQSKLRRTLLFINSFFPEQNIPYLIVKTYRSIPYVTYDVDVLVNPSDFTVLKSKLKHVGNLGKHPGKQTKKQVNFFGSNLLTIDLHEDFSWQGASYMDESIAWRSPRKQEIAGVTCPIPNLEVEFLLEAAHLLFERRYITLLDYIFLCRMSREYLDKHLLLEQVQTHGWGDAFLALVSIVNSVDSFFHDSEHNFRFQLLPSTLQFGDNVCDMPYFLSPLLISKVFYEKFRKKGHFPKWDYLYYLFTLSRYYVTGKRRYPYYREWAPLELIRM